MRKCENDNVNKTFHPLRGFPLNNIKMAENVLA